MRWLGPKLNAIWFFFSKCVIFQIALYQCAAWINQEIIIWIVILWKVLRCPEEIWQHISETFISTANSAKRRPTAPTLTTTRLNAYVPSTESLMAVTARTFFSRYISKNFMLIGVYKQDSFNYKYRLLPKARRWSFMKVWSVMHLCGAT